MFYRKTAKKLIKKELELYKKEQILQINEEIQKRKANNWEELDNVRVETRDKEVEHKTEIAKLEAKREFLNELNIIKDKEIETLKELVSDLIARLPSAVAKKGKR